MKVLEVNTLIHKLKETTETKNNIEELLRSEVRKVFQIQTDNEAEFSFNISNGYLEDRSLSTVVEIFFFRSEVHRRALESVVESADKGWTIIPLEKVLSEEFEKEFAEALILAKSETDKDNVREQIRQIKRKISNLEFEIETLQLQLGDNEKADAKSYSEMEIDLDDFDKDVLVYLMQVSVERDISINDVFNDVLREAVEFWEKNG